MSVMLRLLLAHMLGDFVAQPRVLVAMKRKSQKGNHLLDTTCHSALTSPEPKTSVATK
jgi:hypothetical protein